jgi:hypothetical protein
MVSRWGAELCVGTAMQCFGFAVPLWPWEHDEFREELEGGAWGPGAHREPAKTV